MNPVHKLHCLAAKPFWVGRMLPTKRFPSVGEVASALGCTSEELLALSDEDCAELVWAYTETIPFTL